MEANLLQLAKSGDLTSLNDLYQDPSNRHILNSRQLLDTIMSSTMSPYLETFEDVQRFYYLTVFNRMSTRDVIRYGFFSRSIIGYEAMTEVLSNRMLNLDNQLNIDYLLELLLKNPSVFDDVYPIVVYLLSIGGTDEPLLVTLLTLATGYYGNIDHVLDLTPDDVITSELLEMLVNRLRMATSHRSDISYYYNCIRRLVELTDYITDDALLQLLLNVRDNTIIDLALSKYRNTCFDDNKPQIINLLSDDPDRSDLLQRYEYLIEGGPAADVSKLADEIDRLYINGPDDFEPEVITYDVDMKDLDPIYDPVRVKGIDVDVVSPNEPNTIMSFDRDETMVLN